MKEYLDELKETLKLYNWKLIGALFVFITVLDQFSKQYFHKTLIPYDHTPIIGDFLRLTIHENPGIAFGIELFESRTLFVLFTIAVMIFIFIYLVSFKNNSLVMQIVIGCIMGGAFGNLIDRALFGKVIDFVDVDFFDIPSFSILDYSFRGMDRWPIFNVADMAVSTGFVLISYVFFIQPRLKKSPNSEAVNE